MKSKYTKFNKEFEALLVKHKIDNGFFITEYEDSDKKNKVVVCIKQPDVKQEKPLGEALLKLFTQFKIDTNTVNDIANTILELRKQQAAISKKELTKIEKERIATSKLSPEDKKLLNKYKRLKTKYVKETNYEEAAHFRGLELKLLKID